MTTHERSECLPEAAGRNGNGKPIVFPKTLMQRLRLLQRHGWLSQTCSYFGGVSSVVLKRDGKTLTISRLESGLVVTQYRPLP